MESQQIRPGRIKKEWYKNGRKKRQPSSLKDRLNGSQARWREKERIFLGVWGRRMCQGYGRRGGGWKEKKDPGMASPGRGGLSSEPHIVKIATRSRAWLESSEEAIDIPKLRNGTLELREAARAA